VTAAREPGLGARIIAGTGGALLTALMRTVRWEIIGHEHYLSVADRPCVFLLWHGRLIPCSYRHRHEGLGTLISQHRDGDYIARMVERWWGFQPIRGSSSRGGSRALREIVRTLRGGTSIAITPDGPRGPRQKMKPGPVLAARLAGTPILPASAGATSAWWFGSWDRFMVPRPFSRIRLVYGEPVSIARDADDAEVQRVTDLLEDRLNALTRRADERD
jgi:lysophospholipid acyltransferase (LPLAT)-like uncharacterized protein